MVYINGKCFRNLQEQVAYLTEMIGQATDVVKRVVDIVATAGDLPSASGYDIGDTIAVGSESPYEYYVNINNQWESIGIFPQAGPAGQDGTDGSKFVYSTLNTATVATTSILLSTMTDTPNVGDIIIANGLGFVVTAVSATAATVTYKWRIEGRDGKNFWYTTTSINGSSTTTIPIATIYNMAGLTIRAQDLITCSNGNVATIVTISSSYVTASYLYKLKGQDGLTTKISLNGTDYTQVSGTITLPNVTVPDDLGIYQERQVLDLIYQDVTGYSLVTGGSAPTWAANTYYTKSGNAKSLTSPITYTLQTSQPADWATKYNTYYTYSSSAANKTINISNTDRSTHLLVYMEMPSGSTIVTNASYGYFYPGGTQSNTIPVSRKRFGSLEIINNNGYMPVCISSYYDGYSDTSPYTMRNYQYTKASLVGQKIQSILLNNINGNCRILVFGIYDASYMEG